MSFVEILDDFVKYALGSSETTIHAFNSYVRNLSTNDLKEIKGKSLIMIRTAEVEKMCEKGKYECIS